MRKLLQEELKKIIEDHKIWLDTEGEEGKKANLIRANLRGANLQGADLQEANLTEADLQGANLQRADLRGADLQWANLQEANLRGAYLQGAYLQGAYLQGADLQGEDLQGAYLQRADLREANLQGANLQEANLGWTDLRKTNLNSVDLSDVRSFWKCIGNGKRIKNISLNSDKYEICYTSNLLQIGCCLYKVSDWEKFSDDEVLAFDRDNPQEGLAWWKKYKEEIFWIIEKNPAE